MSVTDFQTVEVSGTCLYISTFKIWPFQNKDSSINVAKSTCAQLSLELAKLANEDENDALREYTSKTLLK